MASRKLAMIGTRGHFNLVLRELPNLPQVELAAIASGGSGDSVAPIADWAAQRNLTPRVHEDWRSLLDGAEDARPEVLVVCGPFELHAEMCIAAIERGVHVLTEKPAALTLEELARLRDVVARRPDMHLAAMMQSRYDANFFTARELIRAGAVGEVRLIDVRKSYKLGRRAPFYADRATYGGTIPWVGSHAIDWIYWFLRDLGDKSPFESVVARHSHAHNAGHGTMERSAVCQFALAGGRFGTVSIDVFRPENAATHGDDWARVVGTAGVLEVTPGRLTLINAEQDGSQPLATSCNRTLLRDFLDQIDGGRPALLTARDTLDVTEACLLARESADRDGEIVRFA